MVSVKIVAVLSEVKRPIQLTSWGFAANQLRNSLSVLMVVVEFI